MSKFDDMYFDLGMKILNEGVMQKPSDKVRTRYAGGTPALTKSIEGVQLAITPDMGVPILEQKRVPLKAPLIELEWIWQEMSNDVNWLQERGVKIWNSWTKPENYYLSGRDVVFIDRKPHEEYYGEPTLNSTLIDKSAVNSKLANHWKTMVSRVYAKKGRKVRFYRGKGVQVHPDWWDVNTFVNDVKKIPNFAYKLRHWDDFVLDKDYYGGNTYSVDNCVWLPQSENLLYQDSVYPIEVINSKGHSEVFMGIRAVSIKLDIPTTTVHRFVNAGKELKGCKGDNRRFNGYTFKKVNVPKGTVPRLSPIEGTLGKAYGYQMKNKKRDIGGKLMSQTEFVLHELKANPNSRRIMTTLFDIDDLGDMALEPCVWSTHWTVHDGKLNLHVKQRSCDVALGLGFNTYQYHVLHAYVARTVGLELGTMYWNIDNAHIYDRHIETFKEQLISWLIYQTENPTPKEEPKLVFPEDFYYKNFFDNRLSEAVIENYHPIAKYSYEIAI